MSLSDLITAAQKNTVSYDESVSPGWRRHVLDHLDYIAARSKTYSITGPLMNLYRYDLKRFLREEMKLNQDTAWIVLLLNNMGSDFEFVNPGDYVIPDDSLILNLYHSYITINANSG